MKCWRKYVLVCFTCICCFGLLTGCGNDTVTETEQMTENSKPSNDVNDVTNSEADMDPITDGVQEKQTNAAGENGSMADGLDHAADDIGDAGADIVDGVGDAGKDVIDGVENAADSLTGNIDDPVENRAE